MANSYVDNFLRDQTIEKLKHHPENKVRLLTLRSVLTASRKTLSGQAVLLESLSAITAHQIIERLELTLLLFDQPPWISGNSKNLKWWSSEVTNEQGSITRSIICLRADSLIMSILHSVLTKLCWQLKWWKKSGLRKLQPLWKSSSSHDKKIHLQVCRSQFILKKRKSLFLIWKKFKKPNKFTPLTLTQLKSKSFNL